jgi:8-oxo-dGTP pyrophosphatase MutT (NUDIX family)
MHDSESSPIPIEAATAAEAADAHARLRAALQRYAGVWPEHAALAEDFAALLAEGEHSFLRARLAGHFTGSAWLVSADGARVLLTHHRKLGRWLQLGGHADGDADLAQVALREAEEESGLSGLRVEPEMFDLDRHWIPERGDVPGHWHYDVRYVVRAGDSEAFVVSEESLALAWREIAGLLEDSGADDSMRRMAARWMRRAATADIASR